MKCSHCGGPLDPSALWTCGYCGAYQELATEDANGEPRVPLTDEGILGYLRKRMAGADSTSLHPIPEKKLVNVRKIHGAHLPPNEAVLGVYDGTVFGSATDGFFVTQKRLGFKNQMNPPHFIEWGQIDENEVFVEGTSICFGSAKLETLYGKNDTTLWNWADVIATLARSSRAAKPSAAQVKQARGPSAWDAIPSAWPAQAPMDLDDTQVERLPKAPYGDVYENGSIVDVHPSGEILMVCGGGTVELRYAQNGARYRAFQAPDTVLAARFSSDGEMLVVGGHDKRATAYDARSGRILGQAPEMHDSCAAVVWLGSTGRFAMGSQQGELWIVNAQAPSEVRQVLGASNDYEALDGIDASPDGQVVFVSLGTRLGAFDTETGRILWRFDGAHQGGARIAVSPRGDTLVAANYEGVSLFNARTGAPGPRFRLPCASSVCWPDGGMLRREERDMSWSSRPKFAPLGDAIALQDHVGNLVFVDLVSRALFPMPRASGRAWIEDLAWLPDSNRLVLCTSDNQLALWQARPPSGIWCARAIGG